MVTGSDGALLGYVLSKVGELAADDTGYDVGHAVVVAELLMLVPRRSLAGLGRPLARLVGLRFAVGQQHAACAASDDLVAVEADGGNVAEGACLLAVDGGAEGLGGVLDEDGAVDVGYVGDLFDARRRTVEVGDHDGLGVGMQLERLLERRGVHVPGFVFAVDEYRRAALVHDGVHRGGKRHVATEDLVAGLDAGKFHSQVQGGGAGREGNGVVHAYVVCDLLFDGVDVGAYRGHPVGVVGFLHVAELLAVHGGGREVDLFLEGFGVHDRDVLASLGGRSESAPTVHMGFFRNTQNIDRVTWELDGRWGWLLAGRCERHRCPGRDLPAASPGQLPPFRGGAARRRRP